MFAYFFYILKIVFFKKSNFFEQFVIFSFIELFPFLKAFEIVSLNAGIQKLNFTTKAGVDPLTYIFYISLTYVLKMCLKNFLNIPIKYRIFDEKTCFLVFLRPFWIFTPKPEIEFSNQGYSALFPAKPDHMPFKFWKYLY